MDQFNDAGPPSPAVSEDPPVLNYEPGPPEPQTGRQKAIAVVTQLHPPEIFYQTQSF